MAKSPVRLASVPSAGVRFGSPPAVPVPGDRDVLTLASACPLSAVSRPVGLFPFAEDGPLIAPAMEASPDEGAAVPLGLPVLWAKAGGSPAPSARATAVTAKKREIRIGCSRNYAFKFPLSNLLLRRSPLVSAQVPPRSLAEIRKVFVWETRFHFCPVRLRR